MIAMEMWEANSRKKAVRAWRQSIRKDLEEVGVSKNADSVTQMHSRQPTESTSTVDTTNPLDLPTEKNTRDTRHKAVVYDADTSGSKGGLASFL